MIINLTELIRTDLTDIELSLYPEDYDLIVNQIISETGDNLEDCPGLLSLTITLIRKGGK